MAAGPGLPRPGFRPLPGDLAAIRLSRPLSFGSERVLHGALGPRGALCIFGSFQQAGAAAYAPEASIWARRTLSAGSMGGRMALGAAKKRVSRRAGPNNGPDRAVPSIHGGAGGGRDAENSGFCTVRVGVRRDGRGRPRLFMHIADTVIVKVEGAIR